MGKHVIIAYRWLACAMLRRGGTPVLRRRFPGGGAFPASGEELVIRRTIDGCPAPALFLR
ncbi:MAG: hypothetical protein MUC60_02820 [Oscillatoria sp. Prado101]|jgi:hypothetical protein|nr:hypothetical protein [Oscillatoria sp. Prado101]